MKKQPFAGLRDSANGPIVNVDAQTRMDNMKKNRLAAIDIGSNSIRCIVVEVDKHGTFRVLDDEKETVRLGEGIAKNNAISEDAWKRAMTALSRMKLIIDGCGVMGIETAATSAVRRASNGEAFVRAVADNIGLEINVISGEEEAELAALSAQNNIDTEGRSYALVDIGGGSAEVVTSLGNHIDKIYSLELGTVVLTEKFLSCDPIKREDFLKLRKHIRKTLKEFLTADEIPLQCLIGSGGTMNAIAAMVMAQQKKEYDSVHGFETYHTQVVHLLASLLGKDLKDRKKIPGLQPERADIIVAGVTVVEELMKHLKTNLLKVNERGIREGLILKGLKKRNLLPAESQPRNWRDSILEYARSCYHNDNHPLHVMNLALEIFDTLSSEFKLGKKERQILEAAALLHDVGYSIRYSDHHKHTYHLVRHSELFGFTPREREIIAQVGRYHRKSLPRKKHDYFAGLASRDRLLVKRLGGIVRLADGLDRRRLGMVTALGCTLFQSTFRINLIGESDLSVELFGGRSNGDLFETAFGRKLVLVAA